MTFVEKTMLANGNISPEDLDLVKICDTPEEVVKNVVDFVLKNNNT
jgi:predicted Rossmann-fold nucleotide-binding protein